jgi:hypothetical protein
MKKTDKMNPHTFFQPTFGNRPDQYIGRDGEIEQFMEGLQEPIGSRNRCTLFPYQLPPRWEMAGRSSGRK